MRGATAHGPWQDGDREETSLAPETTTDTLYGGALTLVQPSRGYRVNVDSLLLADFAGSRTAQVCVDLGAGVGAVALSLHHLGRARRLELCEVEPVLAALAETNLARSSADGAVHVVDLQAGLPRGLEQRADLVVCNPPFFEPEAVRPARDELTSRARVGSLAPFVRAAAGALQGARGRALFAYPARSLAALLAEARAAELEPKRLRFVHPELDAPARLCLLELRIARPGGLVVEPPLVEWRAPAERSAELEAIIAGRTGDRR